MWKSNADRNNIVVFWEETHLCPIQEKLHWTGLICTSCYNMKFSKKGQSGRHWKQNSDFLLCHWFACVCVCVGGCKRKVMGLELISPGFQFILPPSVSQSKMFTYEASDPKCKELHFHKEQPLTRAQVTPSSRGQQPAAPLSLCCWAVLYRGWAQNNVNK